VFSRSSAVDPPGVGRYDEGAARSSDASTMSASFSPLVRLLLWDLDRGTTPYNVLVLVLLVLILFVPGAWLADPMAGR
jgi:hypothetical protein